MPQPLWMALESQGSEIQLLLSEPGHGTVLKARLPMPSSPSAVRLLLEALVAWYGRPLVAALDADAEGVRANSARWAVLLGDLDGLEVSVRWLRTPVRKRARFFEGMGDFSRSKRMIQFGAGGQ